MKPKNDEQNEMTEHEIDQNVEDSFPASDPPSWTLGTDHSNSPDTQDEAAGKDAAGENDK